MGENRVMSWISTEDLLTAQGDQNPEEEHCPASSGEGGWGGIYRRGGSQRLEQWMS